MPHSLPIREPRRPNLGALPQPRRRALVVFVDHTHCRWLGWLKRGFRHCFVVVQHEACWVVCDSLKSHMELALLELPESFDLAGFYTDQGHHVLVGHTASNGCHHPFSLAPLTCVTVAKRLLGVRDPRVHTPWQLFAHLSRNTRQACGWHLAPVSKRSLRCND